MRFRTLGPLEVLTDDGTPVALGGLKQRSVLGLLLVAPNRVVSVDSLIDDVWPHEQPGQPGATLQVYIHNLRKLLEPERGTGERPEIIVSHAPGYMIRVDAGTLDSLEFEAALDAARQATSDGDEARATRILESALALWRGPALDDLAFEQWAVGHVARLEELRLGADEDRVAAQLGLGRHHELVAELDALVAAQPLRERRHEQLMLALYRAGRQAEALAAYQRARDALIDALGIEPGPALRALEQAILDQDPVLELVGAAPPTAPTRAMPPLPAERTILIGQDEAVDGIRAALRDHDLVTITGLGGVGKTRIALEVAHTMTHEFDAVAFVDLSVLESGAELRDAVAAAAGAVCAVSADAGLDALVDRSMLLVLDNCDRVTPESAALVTELRGRAPALRVLTTGPVPLGVPDEQVWPIQPLAFPEPQTALDVDALLEYDAVRLFVYRARMNVPDFALDADNAAAVAEVVRRLDGLPLAIHLAAARTRVLGPTDIAARLDDRFRLLAEDPDASADRHQTLRTAIDWSFGLLDAPEREMLLRLSVFTGTFGLDAAECVGRPAHSDDAMGLVFRLVDRSFVTVVRDRYGTRYRLLETVQLYGREQLVGSPLAPETRNRHLEWFVAAVDRAGPHLRGEDAEEWIRELEFDHDNLRAAMQWALDTSAGESALSMAADLGPFWLRRGYITEGRRWLSLALEDGSGAVSPVRARALLAGAALALEAGDLKSADRLAGEARAAYEVVDDPRGVAYARSMVGAVARRLGRHDDARTEAGAALDAFRLLDDPAGTAAALRDLGLLGAAEGDLDLAREFLEEALDLIDQTATSRSGSSSLAAALSARGKSLFLADLGEVAGLGGDVVRARSLVAESIAVAAATGNRVGVAEGARALAFLAAEHDEPQTAAALLAAASRARADGDPAPRAVRERDARLRAALTAAIGEEALARATEQGVSLSLEQIARLAGTRRDGTDQQRRVADLSISEVATSTLQERRSVRVEEM